MPLKRLANWIYQKRQQLGHYLVGGPLPSAREDDNTGWDFLLQSGTGPADRPWDELQENLADVLEAWRQNFIIRRITTITSSYVIGSQGINISSERPAVEKFTRRFWNHPQNRIRSRLTSWCDEVTRAGELFIALSAPTKDGMSFIRAIPASQIKRIKTDKNDYEREKSFEEIIPGQIEMKTWKSKHTAKTSEPLLLHYPFNRVVGATRGEGDLTPVLPLASRYTNWLKDRVRHNEIRTNLAAVEIEIENDSKLEAKRAQFKANPPTGGAIYVHGKGEKISYPSIQIQGFDAEPDGRAQRMAISAGSNYPMHFLGDPATATRATAKEMGGPTHAFLEMRQADIGEALIDIIATAYSRSGAAIPKDGDLRLSYSTPDVSEADNLALAKAAKEIVSAFTEMRDRGWIDDQRAIALSFRFFGEILERKDIEDILSETAPTEEETSEEK